jgi:superfamily II DNA or RNA helicase
MLTTRGYVINKGDLTPKQIATIKKELTVSPLDYQGVTRIMYPIFLESPTKLYLPKSYGIKMFGPPIKENFVIERLSDNIQFKGELRPEQEEPVLQMVNACKDEKKSGGLLNIFCGGGKTTMSLYILLKLGLKALIVVHKDFLLEQWKERIEQFIPEARIGCIKAKVCETKDKDIVLASLQSLSMKEYDKEVFQGFGTLIIDEVHHTSAQVFNKALFKTCFKYSIGLSATIERKDGLSKVFEWHLGDIVYKSDKREDFVQVKVIKYTASNVEEEFMKGGKINIAKMLTNLTEDDFRNNILIENMDEMYQEDRKTLILSDRVNHLKYLYNTMKEKYNDAVGIYIGGMKQSALKDCEDKKLIFATYAIASEGYDQKGLDTLILASPRTDIIQSVGRILRDKEQDRKSIPMVVDLYDNFSIFQRQYMKRKSYYKKHNYKINMVLVDEN